MDTFAGLLARQYPFRAVVEPTGGWSIVFPDLPGCTSYAATWEEVSAQARAAFVMWMESEHEQGHSIPAPTVGDDPLEFGPESFALPVGAAAEDETTIRVGGAVMESRRSG